MIHAYDELYVKDAKYILAECFDYLACDCGMDVDWAAMLFVHSGYARLFGMGNPAVVAGMSGVELAHAIIRATYQDKELPEHRLSEHLSSEYWAGWALAEYQWFSGRDFSGIFKHVSMKDIVRMYPAYHEMDERRFCEAMEACCSVDDSVSRLKRLREYYGLSQSELAKASGVGLRSIQMYEQRVNDIDKAQAQTLYRLSRVLNCTVEDLLEHPMQQQA